jgi:hypothetical protein
MDAHSVYMQGPGERCTACLEVPGRTAPHSIPIRAEQLVAILWDHPEVRHNLRVRRLLWRVGETRYALKEHRFIVTAKTKEDQEQFSDPDTLAALAAIGAKVLGRPLAIEVEMPP